MKIMIQNRRLITEQPRVIWVAPKEESETQEFEIASNSRRVPVLGVYDSEERATEVLKEMFEWQRDGNKNFYMPKN